MIHRKHRLFLLMAVIALLLMSLLPAIPQDTAYHAFADQRSIGGLANFMNVMSNLPFAIVGVLGIYRLYRTGELAILGSLKFIYGLFFVSLILIGLGSPFYHLQPDNYTLVWDRLPMSMAFMAFFCIILGEYIDEAVARQLFIPLLITGLFSVLYWYWTETREEGDLRLYVLVQYLPLLLIPIILWRGTALFSQGYSYWVVLGCYALAKVFELNDKPAYDSLAVISGHSIKHLIAALGAYVFYRSLRYRKRLPG